MDLCQREATDEFCFMQVSLYGFIFKVFLGITVAFCKRGHFDGTCAVLQKQ